MRQVTDDEADLLFRAEQVLIRDCMVRQGFSYSAVPRNPVPELREFPYVVDDVAWAGKYGYGTVLMRRHDRAMTDDPNERYFRTLPPERQSQAVLARNGDANTGDLVVRVDGLQHVRSSSKGCMAGAERELYGDLRTWTRARTVSDALESLRPSAVIADPRYTAAVGRWSRCMRERGHPYPTPAAAKDSVAPKQADVEDPTVPIPKQASAAEIRLAVAEATCASRTDLAATARAVDRHHADVLRGQYLADVAAKQRLQLEALPRARAIVAAG